MPETDSSSIRLLNSVARPHLTSPDPPGGAAENLSNSNSQDSLQFSIVRLLAVSSLGNTKGLLFSDKAENHRAKCVCCFFVFRLLFLRFVCPFDLQTSYELSGVMRSNCVLLSSFSHGGLFIPQLDLWPPPPFWFSQDGVV